MHEQCCYFPAMQAPGGCIFPGACPYDRSTRPLQRMRKYVSILMLRSEDRARHIYAMICIKTRLNPSKSIFKFERERTYHGKATLHEEHLHHSSQESLRGILCGASGSLCPSIDRTNGNRACVHVCVCFSIYTSSRLSAVLAIHILRHLLVACIYFACLFVCCPRLQCEPAYQSVVATVVATSQNPRQRPVTPVQSASM